MTNATMDRETKRQELADRLVKREVLYCQTHLVESICNIQGSYDSIEGLPFTLDDIEGLYEDVSDLDFEGLKAYAAQYGMPWDDTASEEVDFDDLRLVCEEHAQENPAEVFEWWLVTEWLYKKLRERGEVTLSDDWDYWWGRCCTGQSIYLDASIQELAMEIWPDEAPTP